MEAGQTVSISGTCPDGKMIELVKIRLYGNGNRHLKFNQSAMLRFNVTVSRLLGWVRDKESFEQETESKKPLDSGTWHLSDNLDVLPSNILAITDKR